MLHVVYAVIIDKLGQKIIPEKRADSASEDDEETKWRRYMAIYFITYVYFFGICCGLFTNILPFTGHAFRKN